jgi:hypothetical protein
MKNVFETGEWAFLWRNERYGQDAVEWAQRVLKAAGWTKFQEGRIWRPLSDGVPSWLLEHLSVKPDEIVTVQGNLLLNEGIQELWDLGIGAGGTTPYNNANADIGVGDSATAAVATHVDLQAASNKLFKTMNATYPIRTNQSVEWRSDFLTAEANWVWNEWSIRNGVTRNKNLNRKVENLGTKTTGTWTMSGTATLT